MTEVLYPLEPRSHYFERVPREINPLKENQLYFAPTRREKVIANRRKGFQNKLKTELCKHYQLNEPCPKGDTCSFAHGIEELRAKPVTNYRTVKCRHFQEKGWCQYGPRCQFLHNDKNAPIREFKVGYSQLLRMMDDMFVVKDQTEKPIEQFMDESVNITENKLYKLDVFKSFR